MQTSVTHTRREPGKTMHKICLFLALLCDSVIWVRWSWSHGGTPHQIKRIYIIRLLDQRTWVSNITLLLTVRKENNLFLFKTPPHLASRWSDRKMGCYRSSNSLHQIVSSFRKDLLEKFPSVMSSAYSPSWNATLSVTEHYLAGRKVHVGCGDMCGLWWVPPERVYLFVWCFELLIWYLHEQECTLKSAVQRDSNLDFTWNLTGVSLRKWNQMVNTVKNVN
jgi:hypothetical protein